MLEENRAIIKRQDKLTVDLHQKNEVCQIRTAQIEEDVQKQTRETTNLEMKIKEISDNRKEMSSGINKMEKQLIGFREQKFRELTQNS